MMCVCLKYGWRVSIQKVFFLVWALCLISRHADGKKDWFDVSEDEETKDCTQLQNSNKVVTVTPNEEYTYSKV
jgi:hypothetical protein